MSGAICMNACFLYALKVVETFELTLHLHSYLQIKAKNYDKVEKVSIHHTRVTLISKGVLLCPGL